MAGKRVVLVDDSIVRGTTSVKIVQMVREAGAKEVHMRIAEPADHRILTIYGIDTPERDKLLAATHDAGRNAPVHRRATRWPSSRSTASTAPWASPAATRCARNSPTIASPANIPPRSPTRSARADESSSPCSPRSAELFPMGSTVSQGRDRRSSPARRAGIGRAAALALRPRAPTSSRWPARRAALEELDDEIQAGGRHGHARARRPQGHGGAGQAGRRDLRALGQARYLRRQAGVLGPISPLGHVTPKEWDEVMAVNVTANWRLIRSLDPLLRRSDAGRAMLLSSGASWKCNAYWGPYSVSKAAVDALGRTYAAETASTPVKVMLVNPGPLRTRMRAAAMPGEDPLTLRTPEDLAPHLVALASPEWSETGKLFDFAAARCCLPARRLDAERGTEGAIA